MFDHKDASARALAAIKNNSARFQMEHERHQQESIVSVVGGHVIRRYETLRKPYYKVGDTGRAYPSLVDAECYAADHPVEGFRP